MKKHLHVIKIVIGIIQKGSYPADCLLYSVYYFSRQISNGATDSAIIGNNAIDQQRKTWWIVSQTDGSIGPETSYLFDSVFYYCVLVLPAMANHATHLVEAAGVVSASRRMRLESMEQSRMESSSIRQRIRRPGFERFAGRTLACICTRDGRSAWRFPLRETTKGNDKGKSVATVFFNS
jgi:hypothetical protein